MSSNYQMYPRVRHWPKRLLVTAILLVILLIAAIAGVRYVYDRNLGPVSDSTEQIVMTVPPDSSVTEIAEELKRLGLIRESWAFERYVRSTGLSTKLQAGTYKLSPSQS